VILESADLRREGSGRALISQLPPPRPREIPERCKLTQDPEVRKALGTNPTHRPNGELPKASAIDVNNAAPSHVFRERRRKVRTATVRAD
jgi:hypothetical protein